MKNWQKTFLITLFTLTIITLSIFLFIPASSDIPDQHPTPSAFLSSVTPFGETDLISAEDKNPTDNPADTSDTDASDTASSTEPQKNATVIPSAVPSPSISPDTLTLCFTGDLMCLAGQQYTAERKDGSHDYTGSFALLKDIFAECDLVVGNLETILSESNPYSTQERYVNDQPNCNAPADYLDSLRLAGVTHLITANNHCLDGGLTGVTETIAHLDEAGFPHTGTYTTDYTGDRFLLFEKNGMCIALLSFTELLNQRDLLTPEELAQCVDSYSASAAAGRIAAARAAGADFVIVYNHWGSENVHEVRDYQRRHAKQLAEAGADIIIGSHPHCLQEMETIITDDGRSVPCFYSLGNVVSSMTRDINNDTMLVFLTLQNPGSPTGKPLISSLDLLPCHVLTQLGGSYRVITPVDYPSDDEKTAAELAAAAERIGIIFP